MAVPTGFEPAISSLTGTYARPLHHGTMKSYPLDDVIPTLYPAQPLAVNLSAVLGEPLAPYVAFALARSWPHPATTIV